MIALLLAHLAAALLAPPLVRRMGRNAFYVLAAVPGGAAVWTATLAPSVLAGSPREISAVWLPTFGIELAFRLDVLSWVMLLIVTGIGALVLAYCARYFKDTEPSLGRFAAVLTAFAGTMAGLVVSEDVMVMFTFWELTTIFSYLLIGHYPGKQASRRAAMAALISTTASGLAMLVGLLMLSTHAGTSRFTGILASDMWQHPGPFLVTAMVLVVVGIAGKSALIPTHFWLPGAMAAPTPVSAYLHAAAMVKAGIYLLLRFGPVLSLLPSISTLVAVLGAATMLLGGWRALRQTDLKLLLAYGTVSQLGFMASVAGLGGRDATIAVLALVIAHALFKAPLFMVVGVIDKQFGTRDLRRLAGVARVAPALTVIGIVSAASMAGLPPLFGFVAKEALFTALWWGGTGQRVLLIALVAGSALTVAYSWRFVHGAFLDAPGAPDVRAPRIRASFWLPPAVIAAATVLLVPASGAVERVLGYVAHGLPPAAEPAHLVLVPHLGIPLLGTVLAVGVGFLLARGAVPVAAFQKRVSPQEWRGGSFEQWIDAERVFRRTMRAVDRIAVAVTPLFQRGSLPYTLGTMLIVLIVLSAPIALTQAPVPDNLVLFHHPVEPLLLLVATVAAIGASRSRRRLRAVFLITATGFVSAFFFLLVGAPDVAITQVLVETTMTVVMVLVLRRLPLHFSRRPLASDQWVRWGIAIGTAAVLCGVALYAADARSADPLGRGLLEAAWDIGAGHNVVNVTLVDARVWDTMGEISVLVAVATGVASLVFVTRREQSISRLGDGDGTPSIWRRSHEPHLPRNVITLDTEDDETGPNQWRTWLSAGRTLAPERRMVILEVIARVVFPLMMLFSLYLLMAGHNSPGGGFAGGLVAGLALTIRYLAGGRYELIEAAPVQAGHVLGAGLAIAVLSGLFPLTVGGGIFTSYEIELHLPLIGDLHLVSAMLFDIGVYLVVIGVVLDFLRSLGAQIDTQQEADSDVR